MNTNSNSNKMTTVKTIYARAAVLLLALNFCLTGYVVIQMSNATQEQIEGAQKSVASSKLAQEPRAAKPSDDGRPSVIETRERE